MRTHIILATAALTVAVPAIAQNAKGSPEANQTTTTTNPMGTTLNPPPAASPNQTRPPDTPIDRGNSAATQKSQYLDDPKNGLMSK